MARIAAIGNNVGGAAGGFLAFMILAGIMSMTVQCAYASPSTPICENHEALPLTCGVIVFDGDSIAAGAGASPGLGPDFQFMRALDRRALVHNIGVAGRPVSECLRLFDQLAPLKNVRALFHIVLFHAGDNDIGLGRTAVQTYDAFTQYVALAHAQAWKVVVSTEIPRPDFSPAREAELEAYNEFLVENKAGADAVVDIGVDRRFMDLSKRTDSPLFSPDHVHPNDAGYAIFSHMLVVAVQPLLPP